MYTAFYGLREKPFALSPDPRFLFLAASHREALAHLLYGIEHGEGFIAITGEVGTGKTTLCRTLLRRLGTDVEVAFLFNPQLTARELVEAIHAELGIESIGETVRELMDELNRFLLAKQREGRRVLLIVDEAQGLLPQTLEQIRLLSNLETETRKLIQILLLGQPELDAMLESPALRQLRQRIGVRWRLAPLDPHETREYVRHRLRIAAGGERDVFSAAALREVHRRTRGIPRLVNLLCDRALLAGFAARQSRIGPRLVRVAARELGPARRSGLRSRRPVAWAASALMVLALGLLAWRWVRAPELELATMTGTPSGWRGESASWPDWQAPLQDAAEPWPMPETAPPEAPAVAAATAPVAATPAPLDAATNGSPPAPASVGDVAVELALQAPGATATAALDAILEAWALPGAPTQGAPTLSFAALLGHLHAQRLAVLSLPRTDLATLRNLDHPALLELTAADGVPRVVALRALADEHALVAGVVPGTLAWVPLPDLERRWSGDAYVVWQDFEQLPEVLRVGDAGEPVAWLQFSLRELGFYAETPSSDFDRRTERAVRAFQSERRLQPDGAVGPLTKMALYEALARYPVPRLAETGEVG